MRLSLSAPLVAATLAALSLLSAARGGSVRSLPREPAPPADWSPCAFLDRLSEHEPFVLAGAAPAALRRWTREELVSLSSPERFKVSLSENGYHGPGNMDGETFLELTMAEFFRMLDATDAGGGATRGGGGGGDGDPATATSADTDPQAATTLPPVVGQNNNLSFYIPQQALPRRMRESVEEALPSWIPFRPDKLHLWMGGRGSSPHWSTLHFDDYHNVYLMLNGSKTFQLVPPWQVGR